MVTHPSIENLRVVEQWLADRITFLKTDNAITADCLEVAALGHSLATVRDEIEGARNAQ